MKQIYVLLKLLKFPHLLTQAFKMRRNSILLTVHSFSEDHVVILSTTFFKGDSLIVQSVKQGFPDYSYS